MLDRSTLSLLGANIITVIVAIWQGWSLAPLIWIFWAQSVIIGVFNFMRIMKLKEFTITVQERPSKKVHTIFDKAPPAKEVPMDGRTGPGSATKWVNARFFAGSYGVIHLVYLAFLPSRAPLTGQEIISVFALTLIFLANHWYSYVENGEKDAAGKPSLTTLTFLPYARIFPMHLTIFLGFILSWNVIFFLCLKTLADLLMHIQEHRIRRSAPTH